MKAEQEQYAWVHCIKAIAITMVLILHVTAPYHYQLNELSLDRWRVVNMYEAVVRPCVPLFFMVSGFLLLRFDEPAVDFIVKRINRILMPLSFWTLAYVLWKVYYGGQRYVDFGGVVQMLFFPVSYHLWYLYAVIGCYCFLPILRKFVVGGETKLLAYFFGVWFFASALLPLLQKYFMLKNQIDFSFATGYIGYFVLGYLLGGRDYSKMHAVASVAVIFLTTAVTYYATEVLTVRNSGVLVGDFTAVMSPSVIVASAAWFVLIRYLSCFAGFESARSKAFFISVSKASFGIYLIHVMFLDLAVAFYDKYLLDEFSDLIFVIPMLSFVVFIVSYGVVLLAGRVRVLRKVVGR